MLARNQTETKNYAGIWWCKQKERQLNLNIGLLADGSVIAMDVIAYKLNTHTAIASTIHRPKNFVDHNRKLNFPYI